MTILIGVKCTDGVVIGADSVATSTMGSSPLLQVPATDKITIYPQNIISASTGSVGLAQRLTHYVEQAISGSVFKNMNRVDCCGNISQRFLTGLQTSMVQVNAQVGIGFGALIAAVVKNEPVLIEYDTVGFQPEVKEKNLFCVSMGGGQVLADPFLAFVKRVLWKDKMPTVDQAKLGIYWALEHTIRLAPMGVGPPIRIATLKHVGGNWLASEALDTQESAEWVSELESNIGQYASRPLQSQGSNPPPAVV